MNPVLQAIRDRRSIRGYTPEPLQPEQLEKILQAALEAPSARNTQPWHFSAVTNQALLDEFDADFHEITRATRDLKDSYHLFFHAPAVVFLSTPEQAPTSFSQIDCGIAVENMALAAQSLGLGSVILGMPKDVFLSPRGEYYRRKMDFPEGYQFAIAIALGNPATTKEAHPIQEGLISYIR